MATIESSVTPEDLLKIRDRPMPELVDGQLLEREPMGQEADGIAATIIMLIRTFAKQTKLGFVDGSQGGYRIFLMIPQKVRVPDVSFTRWERFSGQRTRTAIPRRSPTSSSRSFLRMMTPRRSGPGSRIFSRRASP